jgi:UPF0716 protein FxsA
VRLKWRFVPLILLVLAIIEIVVFVLVANLLGGVGWALLLLLAFSAAGMVLLAREGRRGWRRAREATQSGTPIGTQAADGIAGAAGALLLFLPGFISGVVGLIVLIPPVRAFVASRIRAATEKRVSSRTAGNLFGPRRVKASWGPPPPPSSATPGTTPNGRPADEVIEGEIVD